MSALTSPWTGPGVNRCCAFDAGAAACGEREGARRSCGSMPSLRPLLSRGRWSSKAEEGELGEPDRMRCAS